MHRLILVSTLILALGWMNRADAVHVSPDNLGQVIIFPYAAAARERQTLIELRNTDPDRHLLISFQVKRLAGRPLLRNPVCRWGFSGSRVQLSLGSTDGRQSDR